MAKLDILLEKLVKAVSNKFELSVSAITNATSEFNEETLSKIEDLGSKVKELTSDEANNRITKDDVIYGRKAETFNLTEPLIKKIRESKNPESVKVNVIEPATDKLYIVEKQIEVSSSTVPEENKVKMDNTVYSETPETTVHNIKNEIEKLKETLDKLQSAIDNANAELTRVQRVTVNNADQVNELTSVDPDKIEEELNDPNFDLVYIGDDRSTVYKKPKNLNLTPYSPEKSKISSREAKFDAAHHVVNTSLPELENLANREGKSIERYSFFEALDYIEDTMPGKNGLRYDEENDRVYKIEENQRSVYVVLKSKEDIFCRRYRVETALTKESIPLVEGKILSDKYNFDQIQEFKSREENKHAEIIKVTDGPDAGYYVKVLTPEAEFDKRHNVTTGTSLATLINALNRDKSENAKKVIENSTPYSLEEVKSKIAEAGAEDKYKVIKVTGNEDNANKGYYLVRAYTQEEKDLIAEELALSTQGLEDSDTSDDIPNMVVGRYKTSTMNKKSTGENSEYYVVTDVDYLKLPEYHDVVKIKPSDFNESDPKYYLKKHDKDGLDVVYKPTISPEKAPLVVKPEVIEALHKYGHVLSSVYEYENDALKPYTFAKMLLDDVDTDRNNVASLYMTDGKGNYYTIAREEKVAKKLPSTNVEYFYNGHDMKNNFLSHVRDTAITPFSHSHLIFSDTQIDKLIAEGGPFYNKFVKFEDNDPTQIDTDKLLTTRWAAQFDGSPLNEDNVDKYGFKDINGYKIYILKKDQPALTESDIAAAKAFVAPRVNKELTDAQVREVLTRMGRTNISDIGVEAKASLSEDVNELNKNYIGTSDTDNVYNINIADGRLAPQGGRINEYNVRFYTTVGIKLTASDVVELAKTTKDRDISGLEAHYTLDQVISIAGENPEYNDLFDLEYAEMVEKSYKYRYLETDNLDDKVLPLYDRNETDNNNRSKIVVVIKETHLNDEG